LSEPARLHPLPVLGVPGWSDNQSRAYYQDPHYFRTARQRARPANEPSFVLLD